MDTVPTLGHIVMPVLFDRFPALKRYLQPPHWRGAVQHHQEGSRRQSRMVRVTLLENGADLVALRTRLLKPTGITVNSFCVATLSKAVAAAVVQNRSHWGPAMDPATGRVRLKIMIATNERPQNTKKNTSTMDIRPSDLGTYLCGSQLYFSVSVPRGDGNRNDWLVMAKQFQRDLKRSRSSAAMDVGLCAFIQEDWIQFVHKSDNNAPNGIEDSLEISNLGMVELPHEGNNNNNWIVDRLWFAQGRKVTGPGITVTIAGTQNGLTAVLSAFPQAVEPPMLNSIAKEWKKLVASNIP